MMTLFTKRPIEGMPLAFTGLCRFLRAVDFALCNMRIHNGYVRWVNGAPIFFVGEGPDTYFSKTAGGSSDFPNGDKWTWGISYSGDVVTIYNPKVVTGFAVVYPADPTPLTITVNNYWLYYKFTIADSTGVLESAATVPDSTAALVYVPLYRIQLVDTEGTVDAHITGWDRDRAHDSMAIDSEPL